MVDSSAPDLAPNDRLNQVIVWPGLLDAETCARVIEMVRPHPPLRGRVGSLNLDHGGIRRSDIWLFDPEPDLGFVFDPLVQAVLHVNQGYGFDLTGFASGCQVARYAAGEQGHYDWHMDLGTGPMSCRKLSVSVQLSPPQSYDGGDLEFRLDGLDPLKLRQQGTLVAFPSYMQHRVAPVSRGERWSLVAWVEGPPYR
ncbi:MAG: 2OG-Fe(II) oxygenase [Aquabacterium sp.]